MTAELARMGRELLSNKNISLLYENKLKTRNNCDNDLAKIMVYGRRLAEVELGSRGRGLLEGIAAYERDAGLVEVYLVKWAGLGTRGRGEWEIA